MRRIVFLAALVVLFLPGPLLSAPLHPEVVEQLKSEGKLGLFVEEKKELAKLGVDRPSQKPGESIRRKNRRLSARSFVTGWNTLAILVEFQDVTARKTKGYIDTLLFSKGVYPTGSMRDYYLENSYGSFDLIGTTTVWVKVPHPMSYYTMNGGTSNFGLCASCYPQNAQGLVEEAVQLADPLVDFSQFDNDGDGVVDGIIVIHAGMGYENSGSPSDFHSHFWFVQNPPLVDGVHILEYAFAPELGSIGVPAHEFGHVMGLPDLYDTSPPYSQGVGFWSLMGTGVWGGPQSDGDPYNDDSRPVHLDAWSKAALGFVIPDEPSTNQTSVSIPAAEDNAFSLKLWKNGLAGQEYFLVENRKRRLFDEYLKGEGLLIYHIDESVYGNDDKNHYMVAVEQADGRRDLESNKEADSGDPFPGSTWNREFGPNTNPGSKSYSGSDVQVAVSGISNPGLVMKADVTVETTPSLRISTASVVDTFPIGNGDGRPDFDEDFKLKFSVRNDGTDAPGVNVSFVGEGNPPGYLEIQQSSLDLGQIGGDSEAEGTFDFHVKSQPPSDPFPVWIVFKLTSGTYSSSDSVVVLIGDAYGLSEEVESGAAGWSHYPVRSGYSDQWRISGQRARSGTHSWKCGMGGLAPYGNLLDAALVTPFFMLGEDSKLAFYYWIDAETLSLNRAWDGGTVEMSSDGKTWKEIAPAGGYPFTIEGNPDSPISRRGAFSGSSEKSVPGGWIPAEFDLSSVSGPCRVRFRFGADGSVGGEGWYIDDITVTTRYDPYVVQLESPYLQSGKVTLTWTIHEITGAYSRDGFNVYRSSSLDEISCLGIAPSQYIKLNSLPIQPSPGDSTLSFVDSTVTEGYAYSYILEDSSATKGTRTHGPRSIYIPRGIASSSISRPFPNPFLAENTNCEIAVFVAEGANGAVLNVPVEAKIFNPMGRLTRSFKQRLITSGYHKIVWDGKTDEGKRAPAGLYMARISVGGLSVTRTIVLLR
ncbi:MAG: M6 family metalloprotease domain-containing protein [Candidatus Eisenbacteria bacterium]|nr:M6 family metalloprotease domain-containing protein [Candidatus Eisenbacteria bacterium]